MYVEGLDMEVQVFLAESWHGFYLKFLINSQVLQANREAILLIDSLKKKHSTPNTNPQSTSM